MLNLIKETIKATIINLIVALFIVGIIFLIIHLSVGAQVEEFISIVNKLSTNIEKEFRDIVKSYPKTLTVIPILIAKREKEIKITDAEQNYSFDFAKPNYTIDEYVMFMEKTGLFDLLQNHIIHSLVDYVMGVEVGMDTNGRKGRTGDAMEDLVEQIFGEIEDEHDTTSYVAKSVGNDEYVFSGRLDIEKANEMFSLELPESDEYQTIGGLILHEYQSFPKAHEIITLGKFQFRILKVTATKIELVKLKVNE